MMRHMEPEEEAGGEGGGLLRWLITYADLIPLLLAFFIVLYAMSRTEQIKFSLVSQALAQNFDSNSIIGSSPGPSIITGMSGVKSSAAEAKSLAALQSKIQDALNAAHVGNQVAVSTNVRGVEVSLNATLLFTPGSAVLAPSAVRLLQMIGVALKSVPNDVEVVGYTDSTPIRTSLYPSNWQLSASRAANVVYVLSRVPGITPNRLSLAGFGQYHPIATNATAAGRQQNRRVNILVLRKNVATVAIGNGP